MSAFGGKADIGNIPEKVDFRRQGRESEGVPLLPFPLVSGGNIFSLQWPDRLARLEMSA